MEMVNLHRNENESARDFVLRVLRDNIINLVIEPGSSISESQIASELRVSRTPVREAMLELSKQQLVRIFPQKGSTVSKIDYGLIEEARFLRYILETSIIEEVCDKRTDEDIFRLEKCIALQSFYEERNLNDKVLKEDNEFHNMLYTIARKEMLRKMVENTMVHFDRVRRLGIETKNNYWVYEDHTAIVEAIKARDKKRAKEIIAVHLARYEIEGEKVREKFPDWIA